MNKKVLILCAALFVACTSGVFAFGIGVQGDFNAGTGGGYPGLAVTFKLDKIPLVFAVTAGFGSHYFSIGATADYWFMNPVITKFASGGTFNWFLGLGAYGYFGNSSVKFAGVKSSSTTIGLGARVPVGLNFFLAKGKWIEPYIMVAPSLGVAITSSSVKHSDSSYSHLDSKTGSQAGFGWFIPLSLGVRFWF